MSKAQKIKRLWFLFPSLLTIRNRKTTKFYPLRFVDIEAKFEFSKAHI